MKVLAWILICAAIFGIIVVLSLMCGGCTASGAQTNGTVTLMWTNPVTWCANLVEYRNALSESWRFYTLFTNSNVFAAAITITLTNAEQFYRVACVYYLP